jgi:hypothetical protein
LAHLQVTKSIETEGKVSVMEWDIR